MLNIYFPNINPEEIASEHTVLRGTLEKNSILTGSGSNSKKANVVVAEVTNLSSTLQSEIHQLLKQNIPVLALLKAGHEDRISPEFTGKSSENLFVEYYNSGNIGQIIRDFLDYVESMRSRKGKLIVIDGADASGKTSQAKLLVEYLTSKKILTKYVDFPQYYSSFHGKTVAKFLRGEFGKIDEVSPYLASLAYALDRASMKREMEAFLRKGGIIVANRYATSNMAYQGAKFVNDKEREEYLEWEYELEYKVNRIPKEDIVVYLFVPWQIAADLADKRGDRPYLNGKKDIHEEDMEHIRKVEEMYDELHRRYSHWVKINSATGNSIDSKEIIHQKIIQTLEEKKII